MASEWPPNGLPFSCRERARITCQNANDLGRAAVGWNGGLGGYGVLAADSAYILATGCIVLSV
jgi:hypothetical protein